MWKKTLLLSGFVCLLCSVSLGQVTRDGALPSFPDKITIDLKYKSLSGTKDEPRFHHYWGFGAATQANTPFIKSLGLSGKEIHHVYFPKMKGSEWAAAVLKGKEPVALYFDMDLDGKLSPGEKIPATPKENWSRSDGEFCTPEFTMKTPEGQEVPCRLLLKINFYDTQNPNFFWTSLGTWQGEADVEGTRVRLLLLDHDLNGKFQDFGADSISLALGEQDGGDQGPPPVVSPQTLSRLVRCGDQFYRLRFAGLEGWGASLRAVLEKETAPQGELDLKIEGQEKMETRIGSLRVRGAQDDSIVFDIPSLPSRIPSGIYTIESCFINFGGDILTNWMANIKEVPNITIEGDRSCTIALGSPKVVVSAVEDRLRYDPKAKAKTSFPLDASIYITGQIKGQKGETYERFYKKGMPEQSKLRIVDAQSKELLSAEMESG